VKLVRGGAKELTLVLGGGLEVRLGDAGDLRLEARDRPPDPPHDWSCGHRYRRRRT